MLTNSNLCSYKENNWGQDEASALEKKKIVLLSEKYGNNKQIVSVVIYKCATERIQWKMLIVTKSSNRGMLITKCITCSEHNLILNVWCNKSILWHSHGFTSIINKLIYMIVEYLTNIKRSHGIFFLYTIHNRIVSFYRNNKCAQ